MCSFISAGGATHRVPPRPLRSRVWHRRSLRSWSLHFGEPCQGGRKALNGLAARQKQREGEWEQVDHIDLNGQTESRIDLQNGSKWFIQDQQSKNNSQHVIILFSGCESNVRTLLLSLLTVMIPVTTTPEEKNQHHRHIS